MHRGTSSPRRAILASGSRASDPRGERRARRPRRRPPVSRRVVDVGLRTDGWTRPGVPASIRVYPRPGRSPRGRQRPHPDLRAAERRPRATAFGGRRRTASARSRTGRDGRRGRAASAPSPSAGRRHRRPVDERPGRGPVARARSPGRAASSASASDRSPSSSPGVRAPRDGVVSRLSRVPGLEPLRSGCVAVRDVDDPEDDVATEPPCDRKLVRPLSGRAGATMANGPAGSFPRRTSARTPGHGHVDDHALDAARGGRRRARGRRRP